MFIDIVVMAETNSHRITLILVPCSSYSRNMPARSMPPMDASQDVSNVSGGVENGWTTVTFSRALNTGDAADDFVFDGQSCAYFLYAWGGSVNGGTLLYHSSREFSTVQYCFNTCGAQINVTTPMPTMRPTAGPVTLSRRVGFSLRIASAWEPAYADVNSFEYFALKNDVIRLVRPKTFLIYHLI